MHLFRSVQPLGPTQLLATYTTTTNLQVEALALLVDVLHLGQVRLPQHEQLLLLARRQPHYLRGNVGTSG